jgi:hypothetical protein
MDCSLGERPSKSLADGLFLTKGTGWHKWEASLGCYGLERQKLLTFFQNFG